MDNLFDVSGKIAVITGAGGVLCSEIARTLASRGAKVALLGRTLENVELVAANINSSGGTANAYSCDVLDLQQLQSTREHINQDMGTCDILINGAGGNHPDATTDSTVYKASADIRGFFDLPIDAFKSTFDLNLLGTLMPIQVFAQDMVTKDHAVIINISSMSAINPLTKVPAYSGAKAAVNNLTQWLATHFAPVNLRVNAIAPGFFFTKQNKSLLTTDDGQWTSRAEQIMNHTPMGRFGNPEDLSGTVIWLCSEASKFVTGIVIPVDGGFNAYAGV